MKFNLNLFLRSLIQETTLKANTFSKLAKNFILANIILPDGTLETYNFNPLSLLLFILTFGFMFLIVDKSVRSKLLAFYTSIMALFCGLIICLIFDKSVAGFQFTFTVQSFGFYNNEMSFGVDGLAIIFIFLTLFTFPLCYLAAWNITKQTKQFFVYLAAMELLLILTFATTDILYFYIFFESLLIPMFIIIGVWGARERKIKAAYLFFLYTLFGSIFMLFGILYLYFIVGSTHYFILLNSELKLDQQKIIWVCFFMAFAVKTPLFPFHIWLPEAHVEAPTVGSMLLASLLLKLGGYGFIRFSLSFLPDASIYFSPLVSFFALLGVIYGSLSTTRQVDLKRIVAYSSVAHMNLVVLGLFSGNVQGIEGALYLMVGHGIVSAALFFCVGVLYDRYHSRLLRYYGGLVTVMPLFSAAFLFFTLANMSFPGTSNFIGELLIFLGIFYTNAIVLLFSSVGIVISAVYSIWLYNRIIFGTLKTIYIFRFSDLNKRETFILFSYFCPMLLLGLSANFILDFARMPIEFMLLQK